MELEEAIEKLNKFKNNEMQRDKLERDDRCGGWKIGDIYKHLELNTAIETALQALENSISKEKIEKILLLKNKKIVNIDDDDRYRKMCLQVEIDLLQELLEEQNEN